MIYCSLCLIEQSISEVVLLIKNRIVINNPYQPTIHNDQLGRQEM